MQKFFIILVLALTLSACAGNNDNITPPAPDLKTKIYNTLMTENFQELEADMTDKVEVIKIGTECCGLIDRSQTVKEMDYLKASQGDWVFDENNELIKQLKTTYPEYFTDTYVGIANANGIIFAAKINADNKIEKIFMAGSYGNNAK